MKVIDLLNKIAKGEEVPKKIKYLDEIYEYREIEIGGSFDYFDEDDRSLTDVCYLDKKDLNDEVEIIEEKPKKIEKLNKYHFHNRQRQLANKINEIIDYLLEKESDK